MRPLKRPMFKYGGDVKRQGIMHGMNGLREGGVATTMADAIGMKNGGSTTPPGERQATFGAGNNAIRDASGREMHYTFVPATIGAGITALRTAGPALVRGFKAARAFGATPGKLGFFGRAKDLAKIRPGIGLPMASRPESVGFRVGSFAKQNPILALSTPSLATTAFTGGGPLVGKALKGFANFVVPGERFDPFREKPPVVTTKTKDGTRGTRIKTDGAEKVLTAEEKGAKDQERLNKIYKLLGVDRATRNATGKALIDVSRYIDEGGKDTVSKKNISSTISKAISAYDKRLDKVDQLKEAAGVMMAKNYLEGGDKVLDRNLKEAKLRALNKEADPSISNLKAVYKKAGVNDAAGAAAQEKFGSAYGGSIMTTKDFNKQMKEFEGQQIEEKTILDIATNAVKNLEMAAEGAFVDDGYYKVGENIVLIEGGVAKSIVG